MTALQVLVFVPILILAIMKIHDWLFPNEKEDEIKELLKLDKQQRRFFAEFTHKVMRESDKYESAPLEIYAWIAKNYQEWLDTNRKK